jgi:phage baseplate assembly protein W
VEVGFPFEIDERGRIADPAYPEHVEELIEQLLFTDPGERVNRPDLGCGLLRLIFAPLSAELLAVTEFRVSGQLNRWLGQEIQVESVRVQATASELVITVEYLLRRSRSRQVATFLRQREVP